MELQNILTSSVIMKSESFYTPFCWLWFHAQDPGGHLVITVKKWIGKASFCPAIFNPNQIRTFSEIQLFQGGFLRQRTMAGQPQHHISTTPTNNSVRSF